MQLKKYQEVMISLRKRSFAGGASDGSEVYALQEVTKALMTTVKRLPELRAQKRELDNHMNYLYGLLIDIKTVNSLLCAVEKVPRGDDIPEQAEVRWWCFGCQRGRCCPGGYKGAYDNCKEPARAARTEAQA